MTPPTATATQSAAAPSIIVRVGAATSSVAVPHQQPAVHHRRLHTPVPQPDPSQVVAVAPITSDSSCKRFVFAIPLNLANMPTADSPLLLQLHTILCERGAEAFLGTVGVNGIVSREALHAILTNEFAGRALGIAIKWRDEEATQVTGLVTCGNAAIGAHWRLSAAFSATHKVPLTLNIMQLACRFWYATLGREWPRVVSWRAVRGSVESRRILETLLVFHAKRPCARRQEMWAGVSAGPIDHNGVEDVFLGVGSFGIEILEDLATWGVGSARWATESVPELEAAAALPAGWCGYVFHSAELPMSSRGFQHMTPAEREELLGAPIAEILNDIAVTQRAAIAKLRCVMDASTTKQVLLTSEPGSGNSTPPPPSATPGGFLAASTDDDLPWRSLFGTKCSSPQQTPSMSPRAPDMFVTSLVL